MLSHGRLADLIIGRAMNFPTTHFCKSFAVAALMLLAWRADAQEQRRLYSPPPLETLQPVAAEHGMVVAQERLAAEIGADILRRGGNAVDAAVATGFALAVTYPRAGNIGGGGFMVIHSAERGQDVAIDYRETAPAATTRDIFLGPDGKPDPAKSRDSALGIGVPGTVAGLALALEKEAAEMVAEFQAPEVDKEVKLDAAKIRFVVTRENGDINQYPAGRVMRVAPGSALLSVEIMRPNDPFKMTRSLYSFHRNGCPHVPACSLRHPSPAYSHANCAAPIVALVVNPPDIKDLLPGQTVPINADTGGQDISFKWTVTRGVISSVDTPAVIYTAPDSPGIDIVTVEVNSAGGTTTKSVSFNVVTPQPSTPVPTPETATATPPPAATPTPRDHSSRSLPQ